MRSLNYILPLAICTLWAQACYTIVKHSETPPPQAITEEPIVRPDLDYSVVEGTVGYHGGGNTRETAYHSGFILVNREWIINPPPERRSVMYLVGEIDSSFMFKHVRVEGTYTIPVRVPNEPGRGPDYTSDMYMKISKLEVIQ